MQGMGSQWGDYWTCIKAVSGRSATKPQGGGEAGFGLIKLSFVFRPARVIPEEAQMCFRAGWQFSGLWENCQRALKSVRDCTFNPFSLHCLIPVQVDKLLRKTRRHAKGPSNIPGLLDSVWPGSIWLLDSIWSGSDMLQYDKHMSKCVGSSLHARNIFEPICNGSLRRNTLK